MESHGQSTPPLHSHRGLAITDAEQRENVYQHFRFTTRATRNVVMWGAVFPVFIAGIAYVYDVSPGCAQRSDAGVCEWRKWS